MPHDETTPQRIIDTKLPLTWLLSTAATIIATMTLIAINFNRQSDALAAKMDTVLAVTAEMKSQSKERDIKYDGMRESVYGVQRNIDAHELRINNLERSIPRGR